MAAMRGAQAARHRPRPRRPDGAERAACQDEPSSDFRIHLRARGAELVGEVERYEDSYRLCYVRGAEGIIVELAEQIG